MPVATAPVTRTQGIRYDYAKFEEGGSDLARSSEEIGNFRRSLPHPRQFTSPELPELKRGWQSGCSFCWLLLWPLVEGFANVEIPIPQHLEQAPVIGLMFEEVNYHRITS